MFKVQEIELNFCNSCTADCTMCSSAHGQFNKYNENKLMTPQTFEKVIERLKEVDFDVLQTSGNGDAFLNPWFIDYLRRLRKEFPTKQIHNYSSFVSYDPEIQDVVIYEKLLDKQHTRIETLDLELWKCTARMNVSKAWSNIKIFAGDSRRTILFSIGYFSLLSYIRLCHRVLGKSPYKLRLSPTQIDSLRDEFDEVITFFKDCKNIEFTRINQSLWAEREDPQCPRDNLVECPKLSIFEKCIWICPDGSYNLCGYDDTQHIFRCGSIFDQSIEQMFSCQVRKDYIDLIRGKKMTGYPCNNPKCCKLNGGC
jgi:hypothetical protein